MTIAALDTWRLFKGAFTIPLDDNKQWTIGMKSTGFGLAKQRTCYGERQALGEKTRIKKAVLKARSCE